MIGLVFKTLVKIVINHDFNFKPKIIVIVYNFNFLKHLKSYAHDVIKIIFLGICFLKKIILGHDVPISSTSGVFD